MNLLLFLFNLLPILPLDGGHVAGALWEGLRRWGLGEAARPARPRSGRRVTRVASGLHDGIALIALSSVVILADVVKPISLYG